MIYSIKLFLRVEYFRMCNKLSISSGNISARKGICNYIFVTEFHGAPEFCQSNKNYCIHKHKYSLDDALAPLHVAAGH
jgi:hypothetical protein